MILRSLRERAKPAARRRSIFERAAAMASRRQKNERRKLTLNDTNHTNLFLIRIIRVIRGCPLSSVGRRAGGW